MIHLTPTKNSDLEQCPAKFKYRWLDKLPDKRDSARSVGAAFHAFAYEYMKHLQQYRIHSDYEWVIKHANNRFYEPLRDLTSVEYEDVKDIILRYFDDRFFLDVTDWDHCEFECEIAFDLRWKRCAWNDSKKIFRMRVDYAVYDPIREIATVVDYKTNRALPASADEIKKSDQMLAGAFGTLSIWPQAQQVNIVLSYVRYGKTYGRMVSREEAKMWPEIHEDYYRKKYLEAQANNFPALVNEYCHTCSYIGICPEYKKIMATDSDMKPPQTQQEADVAGKQLLQLEAAIKILKTNLRTWTNNNGDLHLSGDWWIGHHDTKPEERDIFVLREHLDKYGLSQDEMLEIFNVDSRKMRKLLKERNIPLPEFKKKSLVRFEKFRKTDE